MNGETWLTSWLIASSRKSTRMWMWIGRRPPMAAPRPKPVIAASLMGVSMQRPGPNLSASPVTVPKTSACVGTPTP